MNDYISQFITSPIQKKDGIFDSTFGLGFPTKEFKINNNFGSIKDSISETINISKDITENLFLAVSFAEIINLYEIKISRGNKLYIQAIGHYINDKEIIHINFFTNSYIGIISNDYHLKVINTFAFDKYEYKKKHSSTKNGLLIYDTIELKKLNMMKQTNINKYNEKKK